jgi:hypothetical protein
VSRQGRKKTFRWKVAGERNGLSLA